MSLPKITLMQADEVGRPFHRDGWVYEEKYDGWRMVAYKDGIAVRLVPDASMAMQAPAGVPRKTRVRETALIRSGPPARQMASYLPAFAKSCLGPQTGAWGPLCRASLAQHHPTPRGRLLKPRPRGHSRTLLFARRMAEPLRYLRQIRAI